MGVVRERRVAGHCQLTGTVAMGVVQVRRGGSAAGAEPGRSQAGQAWALLALIAVSHWAALPSALTSAKAVLLFQKSLSFISSFRRDVVQNVAHDVCAVEVPCTLDALKLVLGCVAIFQS